MNYFYRLKFSSKSYERNHKVSSRRFHHGTGERGSTMEIIANNYWKRRLGLVILSAIFLIGSTGFTTTLFAANEKDKSKKDKKNKTTGSSKNTISNEASGKDKNGKKDKKSNKREITAAPQTPGTPILWQSRGNISELNLFWGIGGEASAPKPPFTFEKEDLTGTNPKVKVIDANGIKWNVKFAEEVNAEVAASRLVWACGYMVEESHFVRSGKITGVKGLSRAKKFLAPDGSFTNAMFEERPDTIARRNIRWSWDATPFKGSKELSGLAILNVMLNNWDAKVDNNNVLGMYGGDNRTVYDWYVQSDWGSTFGKSGGYFSHTKWNMKDYTQQAFIEGVSGGNVKLHYTGKMGNALKSVPVEHAKWFAGIVGQLSDNQIRDAFKAAGANDQEVNGFAARFRQKISELKAIANK